MDNSKRKELEAKGWEVGTVDEFLDLTPEESTYIEIKLALGRVLKRVRERSQITQKVAAEKAETSQPRLANLEAGDSSVTIDRQIKALLSNGATTQDLAEALSKS